MPNCLSARAYSSFLADGRLYLATRRLKRTFDQTTPLDATGSSTRQFVDGCMTTQQCSPFPWMHGNKLTSYPIQLPSHQRNNLYTSIFQLTTHPLVALHLRSCTECISWIGGNKSADIQYIRRIWVEDALVHSETATGPSHIKLLVFCNKQHKVEQLAAFLDGRSIKRVATRANEAQTTILMGF